ncbi:L-threonylcarbamoyladenylate synthase, partial [Mesonia mobilis]|uniref:L-threonylcarbamoyladenylate synthase n=1 Tax=Mesonia mobilis TaxID=369791 RepID=UPI0026EACDEA
MLKFLKIHRPLAFTLLALVCFTLNSCGIYSLSGASVGEAETFQVNLFQNNADLVEPGIDRTFTNQLQDFIKPVDAKVLAELNKTWPGPVTWLLPVREEVPMLLTGLHDTIAVRVTAHP